MPPSGSVPILTDTHSTPGQSGGELVGAEGAKLYAREHAAIRKSSNKRLVPFYFSFGVGSSWAPVFFKGSNLIPYFVSGARLEPYLARICNLDVSGI